MKTIKSFFNSIGLFFKPVIVRPHTYDPENYLVKKKDKLTLHKEYIKNIENDENNRLESIENKTSQIISQTGLIFSLLSLFVPFIIDKVLDFNLILKITFIIVLSLAYLSYILTINNALKNFNLKKFNYVKNSPESILNHQEEKIVKFLKMEIQDSLFGINNNIAVNNIKATNLITAYNSFKLGNIFTSILVVFLCSSLLFMSNTPSEMKISDPIEIKNFEKFFNYLENQNKMKKVDQSPTKTDSVKSTTGNIGYQQIAGIRVKSAILDTN